MMRILKVLTLGLAFFFLSPNSYSQTKNENLYRIYIEDFSKIRNLEKTGVNIYNMDPQQYIEIIATPEQAKRLKTEGFQIEYLGSDFQELADIQRLKTASEYHDYQETMDELEDIADRFPAITKLEILGQSVAGRDLACIKISDNPDMDEDEIPILICGAHHGNEVLSVEATLYQINYLVDNYGTDNEVTNWIDNYEIWFIPLVNPDGREATRRTNDNGIDLNRNYSFEHTATGNHGEPFSEPETQVIRDLTALYPPVMSLTYHTSGRYVLYSWTHTDDAAPDSSAMTYFGNIIAESIVYPDGGSTDHYELMQGGRWYFTAGEYCDYLYAIHNTLAFTVEMWTRQNPDGSVIPQVVERNLVGFKTFLRQAEKSGVSGLITDKSGGQPIQAHITVPAIDDQGKVNPVLSNEEFGRYYKYLAPGSYRLQISAEGYRDQLIDVIIDPENLMALDIQMEAGPMITMGDATLLDGNGEINLNENLGYLLSFNNTNEVVAEEAYVLVSTLNPYLSLQSDSLYIGDIAGNDLAQSADTLFFTIDDACPDTEELEFIFTVYDSEGPGWILNLTSEVYAPNIEIQRVRIMDPDGDQDGVWDAGEKITADIQIKNIGRQTANNLLAGVSALDEEFTVLPSELGLDELEVNSSGSFMVDLQMAENVSDILIGEFLLEITTTEGYSYSGTFQLTNVDGFYDDFERGENGWTHGSYQTTSNHHDDWMLGLPAGKARDPNSAYSGENCWGTDMGWELYMGETWNGEYQTNVHNYLKSPLIDCSGMSGVGLRYMRWLTVLYRDAARILVNDSIVWEASIRGLSDHEWEEQIIDISDIADDNPDVRIVFELESNSSGSAGGWNVDDVVVANGIFSSSSVDDPEIFDVLKLAAYPNPFSESTIITYNIFNAAWSELTIVDAMGRVNKQIFSKQHQAGTFQIKWDGTNDQGDKVSNGLYFIRLRNSNGQRFQRVIMMQ